MLIIDVEDGCLASFGATLDMCNLATKLGCAVRCTVLGKAVIANPGDDPHKLYAKWWADHIDKQAGKS